MSFTKGWIIRYALILPMALLTVACDDKPAKETEAPVRPVKTLRVTDANVIGARGGLPGQARSAREAMLSFAVAGRVRERRVKVGDHIKKGDVVAMLDAAPYEAEAQRAAANLQRARAALVNAASQFERDKQLFAKGIIAKVRLDNSEAAAQQARAEVKSLEAGAERAKIDLGYTELRAPFAGIVSAVFAENFEEVKPQQAVMRLIDPAEIEMIVNVPESMISFVPHIIDLKATFDAFPGVEIPAVVSEVGTEPSETTRTYRVKLLLTPPQGTVILPGMAGRVRGKPGPEIAKQVQGVVVPLSATFSPDDTKGSFVWVVNERTKTVHRVAVALGEPVIGGVSVTSGLTKGDLVVTAGVHSLREGQPVRIPDAEASVPQ